MTLRYRTFLIDLDGTLIDSKRDIATSLRRALSLTAPERPLPAPEEIYARIGRPLHIMVRELGYTLSPEQEERMHAEYREHYAQHWMDTTTVYPGVPETLRAIAKEASVMVVTTKQQGQAEGILRSAGLASLVGGVQGIQPGLNAKPAPDLLDKALTRLGAPREGAVMVGDTEEDLKAARAAGVAGCAVLYGFRSPETLRKLRPDHEIERFSDLLSMKEAE